MNYFLRIGAATFVVLRIATSAAAQTPQPQPQAPAPQLEPPRQKPATPAPPRTAGTAALTLSVQVTDKSGNPIADVAVAATGPVERSAVTGRDGSIAFRSMRAGQYRLRFEHEGFITLEREQVVRPQATDVSVALNPAPVKTPPPPPPPPPAEPVKPVAQPSTRVVEPRYLDIPDYVEKNLVRSSEPQRMTTIGCTDGGTVRILQVREPLNTQQHADSDEVIYVVAGAGFVKVREQETRMDPGAYMLIPRGVTHSMRRSGGNPMITLSMLLGAPCIEMASGAMKE
jgi:mannose-6-phosphate isomerase-like protein (cupin superfamily)